MLKGLGEHLKKRKTLVVSLVLIALAVSVITLKWRDLNNWRRAQDWKWTGVIEYTTKRTTETTSGKIKTTEEIQSHKTLWDGFQLAGTVAVPIVLAVGGYLLNQQEKRRAEILQSQEKERAEENLREATLQAYFDRMSELLTNKKLGNKEWKENPARDVARAITLTVLRSLSEDGLRKGAIMNFLYEADLIQKDSPIIDLTNANLERADLRQTYLKEAHLVGANLRMANLEGVNLEGAALQLAKLLEANLLGANLRMAKLGGTNLERADLRIANLRGTNLNLAKLERADLSLANLRGTKLQMTILLDTNLERANLEGANLEGASLRKANLKGADLREAITLEKADLAMAKYDGSTIFPNEFDPIEAGMQKIDDPAEGEDFWIS